LVRQLTKHRFYRAWVTVKSVGSAKSCRPKVNSGYKDATSANDLEERTGEMLRAYQGYLMPPVLAKGTWLGTLGSHPLLLTLRRISSLLYLSSMMRPIAPFSPPPTASPSSSTSSGSVGSVYRECSRSPRTPLPPMASAPIPGPVYPVPRTPMCDARRYRSLYPRCGVAPPTPPPPSPHPSDEEPSSETYDPATELVGDPDEPYVAEYVPYRAPEAYYSDASYGSERESASTDTAPSGHHSSGSSSGSVSPGYGSAYSGSASDGASDDDLVNRYFAGTFPPT
ncbi:hypothetical protein PIB30_099915, partial [Stylosanthes scabra]|nr:hypothetical protein [Stylosanthes scabra]